MTTQTVFTAEERQPRKFNKREQLLAQGFIPPWLDMDMMCLCLPISPNTVDKWVKDGLLPAPRYRGGKQMWKWSEVDEYLTGGEVRSADPEAERIRNGTRRALEDRANN